MLTKFVNIPSSLTKDRFSSKGSLSQVCVLRTEQFLGCLILIKGLRLVPAYKRSRSQITIKNKNKLLHT
jgi:hypothetical protein